MTGKRDGKSVVSLRFKLPPLHQWGQPEFTSAKTKSLALCTCQVIVPVFTLCCEVSGAYAWRLTAFFGDKLHSVVHLLR